MKIAISGSGGLIGTALVPLLRADGHEVLRLVRGPAGTGEACWDPQGGAVDTAALEGCDAVVHLAGESIAAGRWNAARKARIRDSRVRGTSVLAAALAGLARRPQALLCASAIGYYGDRAALLLDESAAPGSGFLAEVCREWEAAADAARTAGIRTVHGRLGMVLSAEGGALRKMLAPFRLGLGGAMGGGAQYWSWISLPDAAAALRFLLRSELGGPVNLTAPNPVPQREFARALGRALGRPAFVPMPAFAARLALGEMADALMLSSARVVPRRLLDAGFRFRHPELAPALPELLGA
ncbi:MAG: TIGR01777 family protein [Planctomycetota bacterium]|nr:MAG: TIGR01777 family protein [Planctomycetota bacterium]